MMFVGDSMPEDGVEVIYLAKRGSLEARLPFEHGGGLNSTER
jgi:hypothetical protein